MVACAKQVDLDTLDETQTTEPATIELEPLIDLLGYNRSEVANFLEEEHVFEITNAQNASVRFSYPQLIDMEDETTKQRVNEFIFNQFMEVAGEDLDIWHYFDMNYQVMLSTPKIMSVVFSGSAGGAGGFIRSFTRSVTFDINTLQTLALSDFVAIDENLARNLLASDRVFNHVSVVFEDEEMECHLRQMFRVWYEIESLVEHLEEGHPQFFITQTSLAILFLDITATASGGGYAWVEVPFE